MIPDTMYGPSQSKHTNQTTLIFAVWEAIIGHSGFSVRENM